MFTVKNTWSGYSRLFEHISMACNVSMGDQFTLQSQWCDSAHKGKHMRPLATAATAWSGLLYPYQNFQFISNWIFKLEPIGKFSNWTFCFLYPIGIFSNNLQLGNSNKQLIIIIIIKICSAHISTLLGAQGAETEKTWIQTIYSDSKNKIMRYMYNSVTNIHHLWKIVT